MPAEDPGQVNGMNADRGSDFIKAWVLGVPVVEQFAGPGVEAVEHGF